MTTFTATGSNQTYTVPLTTNRVRIACVGGAGGRLDTYQVGGNGHGVLDAVVTVPPGATLTVQVGRSGNNGGWPDTGIGPVAPPPQITSSGAYGGGSSRVWLGGVGGTLLIVGGGGGGVGTSSSSRGKGGNAGFVAQSGWSPNQASNAFGYGGGGGTQSAGGAAGAVYATHVTNPTAGASLHGGNGGLCGPIFGFYYGGGNGGGGYFGGGGGSVIGVASNASRSGGGGGGSSWCPWTYTTTGTATNGGIVSLPADGYVTIDPLEPSFRDGLIIGQPIGVDGLYVS